MLAALATAHANARGVQGWSQLQLTGKIAPGWSLALEGSGRTASSTRARQLLVRAQAGRALSDDVTVWLGYVRAETFNDDRRHGLEQRATGQIDWSASAVGPFKLTLRTRAEARFFRNSGNVSGRLRQQVRLVLPLANEVEVAGGVEPFVTLNRSTDAPRTLDQLRFSAIVSTRLVKGTTLDLGYYNEQVYRTGRTYVSNIIPVTVAWRF